MLQSDPTVIEQLRVPFTGADPFDAEFLIGPPELFAPTDSTADRCGEISCIINPLSATVRATSTGGMATGTVAIKSIGGVPVPFVMNPAMAGLQFSTYTGMTPAIVTVTADVTGRAPGFYQLGYFGVGSHTVQLPYQIGPQIFAAFEISPGQRIDFPTDNLGPTATRENVRVLFDEVPGTTVSVTPTRIVALVPESVAGKNLVTVPVTAPTGRSWPVGMPVKLP